MEDAASNISHSIEKKRRKMINKALHNKWKWSPWRIAPLPLCAYVVTGMYLWAVGTPNAWHRALGPVLTVGTFVIVGPMVKNWWFARARKRMEDAIDRNEGA